MVVREGNDNPLQDSCPENLMDRGAWQDTVHGVAQSQTRLKQLSSSSSSIYVYTVPNHFSHVQHFVTLWTIACQAPLSMGLSRQEYWSGLPRPPPGDLPDPGTELTSLTSPSLAGGFFTTYATWEATYVYN